jgi:soluble lytic murein transglycosylase-like protein
MVLTLLPFRLSIACGDIVPSKEIMDIINPLAYKDFPKVQDILAIISVESNFKIKAVNPNRNGVGTSNGIMQVNGGSFEVHANIKEGVARLREYYKITHSQQYAVMAYNIGIGNFRKGKMLISGVRYHSKYIVQRRVYEKLHYLSSNLGCPSMRSSKR